MIFICLGLGFLAMAGVGFLLQNGRGGSETATATVVRLEPNSGRRSDGSRSTTWCPVIGFTTARGEKIEIVSNTCTSPSAYLEGETMQIDYDPADPQNAAYGGFFTRWLVPLVFAIFATIFIGLSVLFRLLARRGREDS